MKYILTTSELVSMCRTYTVEAESPEAVLEMLKSNDRTKLEFAGQEDVGSNEITMADVFDHGTYPWLKVRSNPELMPKPLVSWDSHACTMENVAGELRKLKLPEPEKKEAPSGQE